MYDILIAGSGFAGSVTALCLNSAGFNVCLVEKNSHPRFTIGESSTPVADMILRNLADRYNLPKLRKLSRYGSWQKHFPEVPCGLKRGFSYYHHQKNQPFDTDKKHSKELLVAASVDDQHSDTQWYRPATDKLFVQMACDAGVRYLDHTAIDQLERADNRWKAVALKDGKELKIEASFLIDATGYHTFSNRFLGTNSSVHSFRTNTNALYSHLTNVEEWNSELEKNEFHTDDYPYNPDHSALHHIIEPGWIWMLRFNNGITSTGMVLDRSSVAQNPAGSKSPAEEWRSILNAYPSVSALFRNAEIADPPGRILRSSRLQRRLDRITGTGWAALHHTAGFVDPLHSTGIAHSLAGVEKLTQILENNLDKPERLQSGLITYQEEFCREIELIDLLVAGCYQSRHSFDLFTAYSMLYFACTIQYEQKRLSGADPGLFLGAGQEQIRTLVEAQFDKLGKLCSQKPGPDKIKKYMDEIREAIRPYNIAGLMDPAKNNMYTHTAADF